MLKKLNTKKYISQLLKIGNNLNQIAKKLNSGTKLKLAEESEVLTDIEAIKKHIILINNKL